MAERDEVSVAKSLPKKHVAPRHAAAVCEEQWQQKSRADHDSDVRTPSLRCRRVRHAFGGRARSAAGRADRPAGQVRLGESASSAQGRHAKSDDLKGIQVETPPKQLQVPSLF